jgi:hypothetical protein
MSELSKWGGVSGGRELDADDAFELAVNRALGAQIKSDDDTACAMWSALANMDWRHAGGERASYTFRAAGDLVAEVRGSGDYMDWYCCGPYATVRDDIAEALRAEGWTAEPDPG